MASLPDLHTISSIHQVIRKVSSSSHQFLCTVIIEPGWVSEHHALHLTFKSLLNTHPDLPDSFIPPAPDQFPSPYIPQSCVLGDRSQKEITDEIEIERHVDLHHSGSMEECVEMIQRLIIKLIGSLREKWWRSSGTTLLPHRLSVYETVVMRLLVLYCLKGQGEGRGGMNQQTQGLKSTPRKGSPWAPDAVLVMLRKLV